MDGTDPDFIPSNILRDFVPANYAEAKRNVLWNGLRALRRIHANRGWEMWLETLSAFTLITEEVAAEVDEPDYRNVDTSKGSPFQRKFLPRWDRYEALLGGNHKPLSKQERQALRFLVKTPEVLAWYTMQEGAKQRKNTHPNRVITAWKSATQAPTPREPSYPSRSTPTTPKTEEELRAQASLKPSPEQIAKVAAKQTAEAEAEAKALEARQEDKIRAEGWRSEVEELKAQLAQARARGTADEEPHRVTPEALLTAIDRVMTLAAQGAVWPPMSERKAKHRKKLIHEIQSRLIDLHALARPEATEVAKPPKGKRRRNTPDDTRRQLDARKAKSTAPRS